MTLPLVSVVTPFHNTAEYLAECIDSVLAQTYDNMEYILVDNQSTDGSAELARSYAERDQRIRVFSTPRLLSQVENYNNALRFLDPNSVYCKFCQADDWLFPRCVEDLVSLAERAPNANIVNSYSTRGVDITGVGLDVTESVLPGPTVCRRYFLDGLFVFGNPSSVLYRSNLVRSRQPFYELGRLHEDTELCFEVLRTSDFGFVHQVLSYLRPRPESTMGRRADFLPQLLDRRVLVERHGQHFLSEPEWRRLRRNTRSTYYEGLGRRLLRSLFQHTPAGFWEYHREGLATIGEKLSYLRIAKGTIKSATTAALSPMSVSARLSRRRATVTSQRTSKAVSLVPGGERASAK